MKRMLAMNTIAALMLCGCGGTGTEESYDAAQPPAAPTENRALLDAVQRPLERAREVDDLAAGRKGELDEQIEGAAQ